MLTVLILAAGYGRRMGPFSRMVNKALIPYDNKPLISHIMEKFHLGTKFVIACGHMGQQVKDYVSAVHNDKQIVYVDIPDYSEGNTGPATTIQHCASQIKGPFVWLSCDTLFDFDIYQHLDHNWIAVHPVDSTIAQDYCWIEREGETISAIKNKQSSKLAVDAFIGLMYCKDSTYIDNLRAVGAKEAYEGFEKNLDLKAHTVGSWKDFGTYDKWVELNSSLREVSFPKPNELFYHDNKKIIKFTVDSTLTDKKANRALLNPQCMPENIRRSGQFLVYDFVEGDIIYNQLSPHLFEKLLNWSMQSLWQTKSFDDVSSVCKDFYYKKTTDRLAQFRIKHNSWVEPNRVNGKAVRSIDEYLTMIDWDWLCSDSRWSFIHGDFQFENLIYNNQTDTFTCIDWRTDFGGESYGDLYYDLGKMLGGILLDYQAVKADKLEYQEKNEIAELNDCSIPDAAIYIARLQKFCESNNLNWKKVFLLVPIIYLNMSPLHETPFDKYLFAISQLYFSKVFDEFA